VPSAPLDYDQLCELLGGGEGASLDARLDRPGQWLFAHDPQRFPLEVLRAKLTAFLDVCDQLAQRVADPACIGVAPRDVVAELGTFGSGVPVRWGFVVKDVDRGSGPRPEQRGVGELLFRTLLGNDQQDMDDIEEVVGRCLLGLENELAAGLDEAAVRARLQQRIAGKDARAGLEAANVLQRRADRAAYRSACASGREPIGPGVWRALLAIAFEATARFQHARDGDGKVAVSFSRPSVRDEIAALRARVEVDLFAAAARDRAIAAACAELREKLRAGAGPGPKGMGEARPFRLSVCKDGESAVQEHTFTEPRVTIGRREAENLVRLNDPLVSAAHAVIELQADGPVVMDVGSTNGTEVDGIRLPVEVEQPLHDGSVLRIGPFSITFHAGRRDAAGGNQVPSAEDLLDSLQAEYARHHAAPAACREALRAVLGKVAENCGSAALLARLEEVARRCRSETQ